MAHSANTMNSVHVGGVDYEVHDAQAEHLDNKVTSVRAASSATDTAYPTEKAVASAIASAVSSAVRFMGTKATVADVKAIASAKRGDLWICTADSSEWVCKHDISVATASAWEELGKPVESLGQLAYSDTASASYTPAGTVSATAASTTTVNSIEAVGTLPTHAADTFTQGDFSQGEFSQGTLPTFSASVTNGVLSFSFSQGTLPTHASDSFTKPTFAQGAFSQGTLPTKGANTTVATEGIKSPAFSGTAATITVSGD